MSTENTDFTIVLSNMEAKRAALDSAIVSLRAAIATGALGGASGAAAAGDQVGIPAHGIGITHNAEIPDGAFNGKTVSEAIKLYLSAVKKKQKTRQIVEALKRGGIESTSDNFGNIVYNALDRMRSISGEIAKVDKEWGLSEWYHFGMRSGTPLKRATKNARTKKQKRPRSRENRTPSEEGLPSRIENFLASTPESSYTPTEIATALSVKPISVNVRLKRMLDRSRIAKVGPGQYRASKTGIIRMPVAG
jgi:hypothetical protein